MVKDPAPENFWRSAKWVISKNYQTVYNHSSKAREQWRTYDSSEKGKKRKKKFSEKYEKTEKRKAAKYAAHQTYQNSDKGRLNHAVRERDRRIRKSFQDDPLKFIKLKMGAPTTRILGAING